MFAFLESFHFLVEFSISLGELVARILADGDVDIESDMLSFFLDDLPSKVSDGFYIGVGLDDNLASKFAEMLAPELVIVFDVEDEVLEVAEEDVHHSIFVVG
jgi:hypothetical protein